MRLTLRTLLAYLDDTLEPSQAKVIGQKIAESPTAQELIERIKEVVRRRRLTTPPATGPAAKLDVNIVAEYIDSVLPTEQLAAVEETCLESDVYLAEIAACHQILTVILSEPSLVPPTAKQRMYGLVQGPEAIPYRKPAPSGVQAGGLEAPLERDVTEDTLLLGLPLYRSQGAWLRRLVPLAGVLVLIAALAFAIWKALPPRDSQVAQVTPPANGDNAAPNATPTRRAEAATPSQPTKKEVKPEGQPATTTPNPETTPPAPAPEPPPAPATTPNEQPAPRPTGARKAIGTYLAPEAEPTVLLARAKDTAPWKRLAPNSPVVTEDYLLSLPGYRSKVHLQSGIDLVLWGGLPDGTTPVIILESAAVLHDSPDADLDLTLRQGRVRITNAKPGGASSRVRVGLGEEAWELVLEGGSEVAVEVSGRPFGEFRRDPDQARAPEIDAGLFLLKGQTSLKVGVNTFSLREGGPALFYWSSTLGPAPAPLPLARPPLWAGKTPPPGQPAMTGALAALSKRLKGEAVADVVLVLTEMTQEDRAPDRQLATYCLGAVDAVSHLLDALADERHADVRQPALITLRHWISASAAHDQQLYELLAKKYHSGPAEIVMSLFHDLSPVARAKPETYEQLIEYLKNDKLPIRELASWQLTWQIPETREIAKKIPYDPAGGIDQRDLAYQKWKEIIPDGKLPPRGAPAAPGTPPKKPGPAPR